VVLGSGTSGGVLAPLLIIGGGLGAALAHVLPAASPGFCALLTMSATMGGTMRSPLTATFFAAEVTGNTHVLLPLLTACVTAHVVTVLLMRRSILTEKVARRGHHLAREYRVNPFTLTRTQDVMVTDVQTVPDGMTLHQAAAFLTAPSTNHPSFPVIDADHHVLGIVDPPTVLAWRRAGKHRHSTLAELLSAARPIVAYPDEYLDAVIERMSRANIAHIPIIARESSRLVGYIGWKDLMQVRTRLQAEERDRVVFYRVR
jgi:chloride channel protein, CIC family